MSEVHVAGGGSSSGAYTIRSWSEADCGRLRALGWALPAVVSGLREDCSLESGQRAAGNGDGTAARERYTSQLRDARRALEWLVALAFSGGQHALEGAVAQGFRADAMRHASDLRGRIRGPGWVATNRRILIDVCLPHAEFWYARMALIQALALYSIAGADRRETLAVLSRRLYRSREPHPFVCRAAEFAKRAIDRHDVGSLLWEGLIWRDESQLVARRATRLDDGAAQLVADVALLLNLTCSCDDQHARFGDMSELPHCLSRSRDRSEVLGAGCPGACGWNLCPYTVPRPDSPRTHRNLSRAFCRQQQQIVQRRRRRLPWHRGLRRGALEAFWWEMERRARN